MKAMLKYSNNIFLFVIIVITVSSKSILGDQAYFDLSDNEIEIQTNFNGKEVANLPLNSLSTNVPVYDRKWKKNELQKKINSQKDYKSFEIYDSLKKI